jgi:hypothetical protein
MKRLLGLLAAGLIGLGLTGCVTTTTTTYGVPGQSFSEPPAAAGSTHRAV